LTLTAGSRSGPEHHCFLTSEYIDAVLKTAVYAAQAQFDREFKLYETLWKQLSQIRSQIRETLSSPGSTDSKAVDRSLLLAAQADNLYNAVEASEPFLPEEFVADLTLLRELAVHWSTEVKEGKMRDGNWFVKEGVAHLERMNAAYNGLKQKIRGRLQGVARNGVT
jgi:hypothetical protein